MGLAEALARDVSERTRTKGNRYFLGGAVRASKDRTPRRGHGARVRVVPVRLSRDGDAFLASCQCPYFTDRQDFCKHIWAVVLAADAEGLLLGDAAHRRRVSRVGATSATAPPAAAPPAARAGRASVAALSPVGSAGASAQAAALRQPLCAGRDPLCRSTAARPGRPRADRAGALADPQEERRVGQAAAGGARSPTSRSFPTKTIGRSCRCCSAPRIRRCSACSTSASRRARRSGITGPLHRARPAAHCAVGPAVTCATPTRRADAARLGRRAAVGVPARRHRAAGRTPRRRRRARPRGRRRSP